MSTTLTKTALATALHSRLGLTKREGREMVDALFELMRTTLADGEDIKISSFGSFVLRDKAARQGRNPQTNETITLRPRRVVTFRTSQVLRASLNSVISDRSK